jgi:hypothetical protein
MGYVPFGNCEEGRLEKREWKDSNPSKRHFLELAADAVRTVNNARDNNGVSFARKAMIRCGMGLDLRGEWRIEQLSEDLKTIEQLSEDLKTIEQLSEDLREIIANTLRSLREVKKG